jgi:hypothetical protein
MHDLMETYEAWPGYMREDAVPVLSAVMYECLNSWIPARHPLTHLPSQKGVDRRPQTATSTQQHCGREHLCELTFSLSIYRAVVSLALLEEPPCTHSTRIFHDSKLAGLSTLSNTNNFKRSCSTIQLQNSSPTVSPLSVCHRDGYQRQEPSSIGLR